MITDREIADYIRLNCSRRMDPSEKALCEVIAGGKLIQDAERDWFGEIKKTFAKDIAHLTGELVLAAPSETPDEEGAGLL
jgi:hypothetical protein